MSRFLGSHAAALAPYTPGEQPQDKGYIKLNTNESPYPPSPKTAYALSELVLADLRLYPNPEGIKLRNVLAKVHALKAEEVFIGAGSDEVLGYAFMAFFDRGDKVYYPDITYGFYDVYAKLCSLCPCHLPLKEDFTIEIEDYFGLDGNIVIANPNAPTGIALSVEQIEQILIKNPDRLVIIDEAYVDFSNNRSCVGLINSYDNLLVIQTFSKSRALAGMRIGSGLGQKGLIDALSRIKYSFNPYNIDRTATEVAMVSLEDCDYFLQTTLKICATRNVTRNRLEELGFTVLPSEANFLFASHHSIGGEELYQKLKEKGILVRHFKSARIDDFIRITIGTDDNMLCLTEVIRGILT